MFGSEIEMGLMAPLVLPVATPLKCPVFLKIFSQKTNVVSEKVITLSNVF